MACRMLLTEEEEKKKKRKPKQNGKQHSEMEKG